MNEANITYTIGGVDFRQYGVHVSDSDGILSRPKLKALPRVSWDDYHGEDVDLSAKYYEPREITLSCFVEAKSKLEFLLRVHSFANLFDSRGLQRLVIDVHPDKPLIYEVYCSDEISVSKRWNEGSMVGTFKLKLTEPQPIKRVLKYTRTSEDTKTCAIRLSSHKLVNIYWGDGSADEDISGSGLTLKHSYDKNGTYYPVITGCIDEIESLQTNATTVWNKL